MVHLTVAIAKFFGYLLGALIQTGVTVIGVASLAFLALAGAGVGLRRLMRRRRS